MIRRVDEIQVLILQHYKAIRKLEAERETIREQFRECIPPIAVREQLEALPTGEAITPESVPTGEQTRDWE